MYRKTLVPPDFDVPELLETERLRLRPLTAADAVKDFEAFAKQTGHALEDSSADGGKFFFSLRKA